MPEDLAVIGVDDLPLGRVATPPLSTVRTRERGITEAVRGLRGGGPPVDIGVDLEVVARRSS